MVDPQQRMILQHFDRGQQGRCSDFAGSCIAGNYRLRLRDDGLSPAGIRAALFVLTQRPQ